MRNTNPVCRLHWATSVKATTAKFLALASTVTLFGLLCIVPSLKADNASVSYIFHIGDDFLASAGFPGPDTTMAANGDMVLLSGSGTLSIKPKSVTGSGTYILEDSNGNQIDSGTWSATRLLSFVAYGTAPTPPGPVGGEALIAVHLTSDSGGPGADGVMQIHCSLNSPPPRGQGNGTPEPPEGTRLALSGGPNFSEIIHVAPDHGNTVFIQLP